MHRNNRSWRNYPRRRREYLRSRVPGQQGMYRHTLEKHQHGCRFPAKACLRIVGKKTVFFPEIRAVSAWASSQRPGWRMRSDAFCSPSRGARFQGNRLTSANASLPSDKDATMIFSSSKPKLSCPPGILNSTSNKPLRAARSFAAIDHCPDS